MDKLLYLDINSLPLHEAMIYYALRGEKNVSMLGSWENFKEKYDTGHTAKELYHIFWTEVRPSMGSHEIMADHPSFLYLVNRLPETPETQPNPPTVTPMHVSMREILT